MPQRYRLMVQLAAWCALRFGELTELRRGDVDTKVGVLRIRRAVVRWPVRGQEPKSDAGIRDVNIPPHLLPMVREHLLTHTASGLDGLLFPSKNDPTQHMRQSALTRVNYPARKAAGRPDLRFHDLRHTGAVLAAQTGATLAELMGRLGHSTSQEMAGTGWCTDRRWRTPRARRCFGLRRHALSVRLISPEHGCPQKMHLFMSKPAYTFFADAALYEFTRGSTCARRLGHLKLMWPR